MIDYAGPMAIDGEYEPSALAWVRDQVAEYEASAGTQANTLRDTGIPVIIVTMRGRSSGKVRKIALMRVEHGGEYALIASYGGADEDPVWYHNIVGHPHVMIQDGPAPHDFAVREATGAERDEWFARGADAYAPYLDYQAKTDRVIPVLVASRI